MWDEDKYFFNRHDSVSDSVSGSTAGALAGLAAIPLALVFSAVAFLCYELSDVTPMNTRLIITGVGTVLTILLNIRFWEVK